MAYSNRTRGEPLHTAGGSFMPGSNSPARGPFLRTRSMTRDITELLLSREIGVGLRALQAMETPELAPRTIQPSPWNTPPTVPIRDELKYANFTLIPLSIGVASTRVLNKPAYGSRRVYLFIVNTSLLRNMYMNFGADATTALGLPIQNTRGNIEYNLVIPQDDIYLIADGLAATGILIFANDTVAGVTK